MRKDHERKLKTGDGVVGLRSKAWSDGDREPGGKRWIVGNERVRGGREMRGADKALCAETKAL